MSSSLLRPVARLGTAATAATLLVLSGGAAHAVGVTPGDGATATAAPGDDASVTEEPTPPVDEEPAPADPVELPGEPGEWLDPQVWAWLLQEEGIADAACVSADLPAPGEYFEVDQDYLLVLDMTGIQSEETLEVWAFGELVGEPVTVGDLVEVGTDPANDALILCTGTMPADFDGELPVEGEIPVVDDSTGGGDAGGGDAGGVDGGDAGGLGGRDDDGGQVLGPIVQTDRPVRQDGSLVVAGLVLAGAAGMSALGVRRRVHG